jgi:hypothetical protein
VSSLAFKCLWADNPVLSIVLASSEQTAVRFPERAPFWIGTNCRIGLAGQVAIATGICTTLSPLLSEAERLHLNLSAWPWFIEREKMPREVRISVLRPFCNVKKLQINTAMTRELSRALCPEDGPPAEGILPMLCKFSRPHKSRFKGMLDPFIAARRAMGQSLTKRRRPPNSNFENEESWPCNDPDEEISTELDANSDFRSE